MKIIQILLFFFLIATQVFAQNTDSLSYHSSRQLTDTSYSVKKPGGDSTIFLFSGGNYSGTGSGFQLPALTSGSVLFSNGSTISQDNSNLFWDNNNKRLGIGTNLPSASLQVGNSTNNATISSSGVLSFQGTGLISIPIDKYAFNVAGYPSAGIFFNASTDPGLELRDIDGSIKEKFGILTYESYIMQHTGIGMKTPTALLHLAAGTATANSAPLKFTAGTNLTTPENGAIEYNGNHFYATIGSTRYQLDQQASGVGDSSVYSSLTPGSVLFSNGSTLSEDNANFFWDATNKRLGIGGRPSASLTHALQVNGTIGGMTFSGTYLDVIDNQAALAGNNGIKLQSNIYITNTDNLGIGISSPTAKLQIAAGTASAGTAPIKLNPGVKLTTPEVGAIENDSATNHLYWTDKLGSRYQLDNQQGSSPISLTTTGTSGVAILTGSTLNIPNYANNSWSLTGNAGTIAGTNFIGTTDNVELMFMVNNVLAGRTGKGSFSNTSFGAKSQPITGTGLFNAAFGSLASANLSSGAKNTDIGFEAGFNNLTGNFNTRVGEGANIWDTSSSYNAVLGTEALNYTSLAKIAGGGYNTALGAFALNKHAEYRSNIGLGYFAGNGLTGNNTLYISDSTNHGYWKLDSASGTAPSVIGKDASGFWHTYATPSGGGGTYTASNGLTMVGNDNQLGGSLAGNTAITGGTNTLTLSSSGNLGNFFTVDNTAGTSVAIYGHTTNSTAFYGRAEGNGTTAFFESQTGIPLGLFIGNASNNTVIPIITTTRQGSTVAANGMGSSIDFKLADAGNLIQFSNQIISRWTTATSASRTSEFSITGVNNGGSLATLFTLSGNGSTKLNNYGSGTFTGNPTKNLSVDATGNIIETSQAIVGTATLASGTVTVSLATVKTGAIIIVSVNTPGGTQGFLSAPTSSIVNNTSFVINSTSGSENSTVNYIIYNP